MSATSPSESAYSVEDRLVPVEGGQIKVRIVIPTTDDEAKTFPVHVWIHGGGFVFGDLDNDDYQLRKISVDQQIVTVNVDYRLAPEHPFPVGLTDSLTALKWVLENAASIRVDTSKGLIVGGDSAGGNLATSIGHLVRDDPFFEGRPVTGLLLREPSVIHPAAYPDELKADLLAYDEYQNTPTLTRAGLLQTRAWLNAPPADPRYSPVLAPSHAGLAPAFIQYNEQDPLRDDARVLEKLIREAGGKVKSVFYPGVPHAFYYLAPSISLAQKVWRDTEEGLRWLLAGAP
ncbi:alpha/beta-hydrolase [Dichomitus squalens LYAD-421 SS1]|uniref:Alpha/beta-hydrolase n=1 Tax=Dichomitus squalens (strain LYAD-421) TaxID=732165 RepID=R7SLZ3_DICSQ|nr:alpha/beta-hydrolase [Dichomitus squalens LYAD-421 SS1]EJF56740.1 alpha/beta-hydrolase [Dichomitus squalens LYAD-421 SS1]